MSYVIRDSTSCFQRRRGGCNWKCKWKNELLNYIKNFEEDIKSLYIGKSKNMPCISKRLKNIQQYNSMKADCFYYLVYPALYLQTFYSLDYKQISRCDMDIMDNNF